MRRRTRFQDKGMKRNERVQVPRRLSISFVGNELRGNLCHPGCMNIHQGVMGGSEPDGTPKENLKPS